MFHIIKPIYVAFNKSKLVKVKFLTHQIWWSLIILMSLMRNRSIWFLTSIWRISEKSWFIPWRSKTVVGTWNDEVISESWNGKRTRWRWRLRRIFERWMIVPCLNERENQNHNRKENKGSAIYASTSATTLSSATCSSTADV